MENIVKVLDAAVTTGAGTAKDCANNSKITFQIISASVSSGGTMDIEGSLDGVNYGSVLSAALTISTSGSTFVQLSNVVHKWLRPNLTARSDGTYTVYIMRGK